jgi:hypothetical protein
LNSLRPRLRESEKQRGKPIGRVFGKISTIKFIRPMASALSHMTFKSVGLPGGIFTPYALPTFKCNLIAL